MALHSSLSVVIPALNEAENMRAVVATVLAVSRKYFSSTELLLVNDGSRDTTGNVIDQIAAELPSCYAIHHASPRNIGSCYREALHQATGEYFILVPGDNECGAAVLDAVFAQAGTADVIIPYSENSKCRGWFRHGVSRLFVRILNTFSQQKLRYYNGTVLHRTCIVKSVTLDTNGFGYQAELLVKLLRRKHSYREVATTITPRTSGKSKAFRLKNITDTLVFLLRLQLG